jgi:hypothetical protein
MADDLQPRQIIFAETPHEEILDGMEMVATSPVRPFQQGDSISLKLASGATFSLHVDQPEGEGGAAVFCQVDPARNLRFHLDHVENERFRLRMEPHHVELLTAARGRSAKVMAYLAISVADIDYDVDAHLARGGQLLELDLISPAPQQAAMMDEATRARKSRWDRFLIQTGEWFARGEKVGTAEEQLRAIWHETANK